MVPAGGSPKWAGGWYLWNSPGETLGGGNRGEVTVGEWVTESQMARTATPLGPVRVCAWNAVWGVRKRKEVGGGKRQGNSRDGDTASPEFSSGGSSRKSRRLQCRPQDLKAAGPAPRRDSGAAMRPRTCLLAAAAT